MALDFPIVSADSHTYVPSDLWKRLPSALQANAPRLDIVDRETLHIAMGKEWLRLPAFMDDDGETPLESSLPIEHRLEVLEREGIVAEVLYPTWVNTAVFSLPDAALAIEYARIYNDWGMEKFGSCLDRQVILALIPIHDVEIAVREVERVSDMGYRGLSLPLLPLDSDEPYWSEAYDPLWYAAQHAALPVAFHVASGGALGVATSASRSSSRNQRLPYAPTSPQHHTSLVASLVDSGVCERFPDLHFVMGEAGAAWLPWLCQSMDERFEFAYPKRVSERASQLRYTGGGWTLPMKPSDYIRRNIHTTFQYDPTALRTLDIIGTSALMWHSDYPHVSGTYPFSEQVIERQLEEVELDPNTRDLIFGGNAARLFRIPLPARGSTEQRAPAVADAH